MVDHIRDYAWEMQEELLTWRHHLHQYPELSFKEHHTQDYLREILKENGVNNITEIARTGLLAKIPGKTTDGPVLVIRADMDALPVTEMNEVPYVSVNPGIMHACGHDVHMTCVLGAMKILKHFSLWDGTVYLLFQPAEEKLPGGAIEIVESGILQEINPRLIIGQHVDPTLDCGTVGYRPGTYMASNDEIYFTISGKGGHAALPEQVTQTSLAAAETILSVTDIIRQNQPKNIPTVVAFGKIIAEGATNVIPDKIFIEGTFRTMDETWREKAHQLIRKTAQNVAVKYQAECDTKIKKGYPVLVNHTDAVKRATEFSSQYFGNKNVIPLDLRMTSEDFAYYSQHFPAIFFRLGVKSPAEITPNKLHAADFNIDEDVLPYGAGHLAWLVLRFLNE